MNTHDQLTRHGLFDAKVPRYTSYPAANHFVNGTGVRHQAEWLAAVPEGEDVSIYIHIPFCKRLCWFCACRTQGTQTMRPVAAYIQTLRQEIATVQSRLPRSVRMARLHLGGGTPTLLPGDMMADLLTDVFGAFVPSDTFEFSVEIDPTDASDDVLDTLIGFGMTRASIGVQDFDPAVQAAIGRAQSLAQTRAVVDRLRRGGVRSLNLDLLYGLPHQTRESFSATLDHVVDMAPDRLAIYGYAHVPWVSKRQVMIKDADLPGPVPRFELAELAQAVFASQGYAAIGIDHFALPTDSLAIAAHSGTLRRNFQGYTDDTSPVLIGMGASAISHFPQGYSQNAPATSAYLDRVRDGGLAGFRGYAMQGHDRVVAQMVEDLMCRFALHEGTLAASFPDQADFVHQTIVSLARRFADAVRISDRGLELMGWAHPLSRIVASYIDTHSSTGAAHSSAI